MQQIICMHADRNTWTILFKTHCFVYTFLLCFLRLQKVQHKKNTSKHKCMNIPIHDKIMTTCSNHKRELTAQPLYSPYWICMHCAPPNGSINNLSFLLDGGFQVLGKLPVVVEWGVTPYDYSISRNILCKWHVNWLCLYLCVTANCKWIKCDCVKRLY